MNVQPWLVIALVLSTFPLARIWCAICIYIYDRFISGMTRPCGRDILKQCEALMYLSLFLGASDIFIFWSPLIWLRTIFLSMSQRRACSWQKRLHIHNNFTRILGNCILVISTILLMCSRFCLDIATRKGVLQIGGTVAEPLQWWF